MDARALVLQAPRELVPSSFPVPETGEDDGILRIEACGLCGTDHEMFTGAIPAPSPFVPGHEIIGVVEAAGHKARQRWGVEVGQRVAVELFLACRQCDRCRAGQFRLCTRHPFPEFIGNIAADRWPGLWGGYAERLYLSPDSVLLPVPASLDPVLASVFNPLGAGIHWGVRLARTKPGDVVAVLGCGIRGLSAAAAAKEAGAGLVMVTGAGERDTQRLEWAGRFGADLTVDVSVEDPVRALRSATGGRGADVVVDVTAKAPAAFIQALHLARSGGTVVVAGTRGVGTTDGFSPDLIVYKELRIVGALGVDSEAYAEALRMLEGGRWPFAEVPRRAVGLDGVADLLHSMAGEADGVPPIHGVVVPYLS